MTSASARGVRARRSRSSRSRTLRDTARNRASSRSSRREPTGGTVTLSLDDALRMAQAQSQTIEIARAGVVARRRAAACRRAASICRSSTRPPATAKTLASQFSSFARGDADRHGAKPVASQSFAPFTPQARGRDARADGDCQAAAAAASI